MTINKAIMKNLDDTYRKRLPDDLKQYLQVKYSQEPFPYEYSEQDLYTNIYKDIQAYEAGKLNVTVKSTSDRWQEEREYLQSLYIEKACKVRELSEYIAELERMLLDHGLESPQMANNRIEFAKAESF